MAASTMHQHVSRSQHLGGAPFELVVSKLRCPAVRPGTVRRSLLIERLARGDPRPVVSVVAPAGYGKTTLLSQWAERSRQPFAWVSLDDRDNDPKVLLTYIAEALNAVEPISERVFAALASPGSPVRDRVVPALGFAFSSMTSPVVLVLDDIHVLTDYECRSALSELADYVPDGSRLVLAGRGGTSLLAVQPQADDRTLRIGLGDLAFTHEEASSLLGNAGVSVSEDDMAELHRRTEGWPVGLYLAALGLHEGGLHEGAPGVRAVDSFGGDDLLVSEYIESEFLACASARQRAFLTRTAVLERMCGPLCEAVLDQPGATATLAALARWNLLLVPLDRHGEWYRYHHLFREMLLAELYRLEPGLIPVLRRRAASWCMRNGVPEQALEYSIAVEDVDTVADLASKLGMRAYRQGRATTIRRWFGWLEDRGATAGHPMLAVTAGVLSAVTGRPAEAERWADVVDRREYGVASGPEDPAVEGWAALRRALLCRHGVKQMLADADEAACRLAAGGVSEPAAALMQGVARVLCGDVDGGDASLKNAASVAEVSGAPDVAAVALCERSLVAMGRGEWSKASALAVRAHMVMRKAEMEEFYATALVCAIRASIALHTADTSTARQELVRSQRWRPLLTCALPHFAVQARIELARVCLALSDPAGAWTLMREVDDVLRCRPDLGDLVNQAMAVQARLPEEHDPSAPETSALTAAELRLLPVLGRCGAA